MKGIRQIKHCYMVLSSLLMGEGFLFLFLPTSKIRKGFLLVGVTLLLYGLTKLFGYFSKDSYGLAFQFDFALGIPVMVLSILAVTSLCDSWRLSCRIVGFLIATESAFRIQTALDSKRFGIRKWWLLMLFSLFLEILGFVLFLAPLSSFGYQGILGISLILYGTQSLFTALYTIKKIRVQ